MAVASREVCICCAGLAGEREIRRGFVYVSDFNCEVFRCGEAFTISRRNRYVDTIDFFVVQAHAFGQTKFAIDDFETVVRDCVLNSIASFWIKRRERTNDSAFNILSHGGVVEG